MHTDRKGPRSAKAGCGGEDRLGGRGWEAPGPGGLRIGPLTQCGVFGTVHVFLEFFLKLR